MSFSTWTWHVHVVLWCLAISVATTRSSIAFKVSGVNVHKVPLQREVSDSSWCFAASSVIDLEHSVNSLATQVWPSARVAANALKHHLNPSWTVCELGCGPGLPSLTACKLGANTIATDLDPFALQLVQAAAQQQKLVSLRTVEFDLTLKQEQLPKADLYILSDVFESSTVARGAAEHTLQALQADARVWVFAQTDRAQREVYLDVLRRDYDPTLAWSSFRDYVGGQQQLWLCDVDETTVSYG